VPFTNSAKRINAKFKNVRRALKIWSRNLPCLKKQIEKVNSVIEMLDNFEEIRVLNDIEWNLRDILKSHVISLLQHQKAYWKQRGKIKWVNLGDANTRFFHTKATINYRHNYIAMLKENESKITDHDGKADILWKAFKERMGTTENLSMKFNLHEIFGDSLDRQLLDNLESSFFDKEIEDTIKQLPNEKSPGPDGFNNEFIKACWPIIGSDIKGLIQDFYEEKISLESINDSLITLIPKSESPTSANDFRPISLLNSVLRILTKLLSNRLQKVILKLVHKNQYGFLKKMSIHDCLSWAFEYLFQCHQSRNEIVVLKLDFEKAFDKIEHTTILDFLKQVDLGENGSNGLRSCCPLVPQLLS
jgi:hypothetical protein